MSTTEETTTSAIPTRIKEFLFLSLTPFYLWLVFSKLSSGADFEGLLAISVIILVLYLPIQLIAKQYELPFSFKEIFEHDEILNLIYPLFGFLLLVGMFTFGRATDVEKNILMGISLAAYALWWLLTNRLFNLVERGNDETQIKMLSMLFFVIALALVINFPKLPSEINYMYFLELLLTMLYVAGITLIMLPKYGLKMLKIFAKDAFRSAFKMKKKRSISVSPENALEFSVGAVLSVFILFIAVVVPFINWVASITDNWGPRTIAISMTIFMILISAFGAYFQIRIFISYFVKEEAKTVKSTKTVLALFYLVAVINMGVMGTIDNSTKRLESSQNNIHNFNKKVHELDRNLRSR